MKDDLRQMGLFDAIVVRRIQEGAESAEARRRRDIATDDMNRREWAFSARKLVRSTVPPGWQGLGEDLRALVLDAGLEPPTSPNCWGSLILWAVREGILEPTGLVENTRDPKSHACYTKVYRRRPRPRAD